MADTEPEWYRRRLDEGTRMRMPGDPVAPLLIGDPRDRRIAELEAALAYYADEDEYLWRGLASELNPRVLSDRGEIARAAVPHWENVAPKIPTQTE